MVIAPDGVIEEAVVGDRGFSGMDDCQTLARGGGDVLRMGKHLEIGGPDLHVMVSSPDPSLPVALVKWSLTTLIGEL
jgi:hypothetical protein